MLSQIIKWTLIGWLCLSAIVTIAVVGKPRPSMTGGAAALSASINALMVAAILAYWEA